MIEYTDDTSSTYPLPPKKVFMVIQLTTISATIYKSSENVIFHFLPIMYAATSISGYYYSCALLNFHYHFG